MVKKKPVPPSFFAWRLASLLGSCVLLGTLRISAQEKTLLALAVACLVLPAVKAVSRVQVIDGGPRGRLLGFLFRAYSVQQSLYKEMIKSRSSINVTAIILIVAGGFALACIGYSNNVPLLASQTALGVAAQTIYLFIFISMAAAFPGLVGVILYLVGRSREKQK